MNLLLLLFTLNTHATWALMKTNECNYEKEFTPHAILKYLKDPNKGGFTECTIKNPEKGAAHISCEKPTPIDVYLYDTLGLCLKYKNIKK